MAAAKGGLGRGLDALFADVSVNGPEQLERVSGKSSAQGKTGGSRKKAAKADRDASAADAVRYINVHDIMPNVNQPRKTFSEEKISELAESIKANGIIQPIIVRFKESGSYEIVAGERRWRAAIKAGLSTVPCIARELDDEQNMLLAIIENMQREDLNPVEEAEGLQQMINKYGLTQEQVSVSVGKSRPYIANSLRLLKLPEYIREAVSEGKLTAGHARALITVENEEKRKSIFAKVLSDELSVRDTEKLVQDSGKTSVRRRAARKRNPDIVRVEEELKEALGTRVSIVQKGNKGAIEIEYFSAEERERLIDLLRKLV